MTSTPPPDERPVKAIRGNVQDTGNGTLAGRVLVPIENTITEPARVEVHRLSVGGQEANVARPVGNR